VLGIVTGVLLALFPGPGALVVVLWIGAFAAAYGVLLIVLGVRLRSFRRAVTNVQAHDIPPGAIPAHR
jgi:uncharacterized membrane protein HdeD (DUF308 family)